MDKRLLARRIFDAGVAAADPTAAVLAHLGEVTPPALIVAVGKAAGRMAQPAMAAFPGARTLIVTNYENALAIEGAEVFAAGHPVPDTNGEMAGRAVIAALEAAGGPVLALISGGGSALLPAPAEGITLAEKARVNAALLASGLDIRAMNLVRQQVSRLKGGGMLRAAAPFPVTALILSDVIGDDLSAIASGPTVAPLGTAPEARALLEEVNVWDAMPESVKLCLNEAKIPAALPPARNILVGSNALSVAAMAKAAGPCVVLDPPVEGDVGDAALRICDAAGPGVTLWGGETTVQIRASGKGGRNQELALRIASEGKARGWMDWACLQGGSDGRDGPVDAAGGLVDHGTLNRIVAAGGSPERLLANNDSYAALALAGDLLMTGATGTNVADLGVMIRS